MAYSGSFSLPDSVPDSPHEPASFKPFLSNDFPGMRIEVDVRPAHIYISNLD